MFSSLNLLNRKYPAPARQWLPGWLAIVGLELILLATAARAGEPVSPARELQKLIPPDASVVLTVEDLRGQVRELLASRLAAEFQKLPTVKAWFDSEKFVPRPLPSHAPRLTPHAPRLTPHAPRPWGPPSVPRAVLGIHNLNRWTTKCREMSRNAESTQPETVRARRPPLP